MKVVALLDNEIIIKDVEGRRGKWTDWFDAYVVFALRELGHQVELVRVSANLFEIAASLRKLRPDIVFNLTTGIEGDRTKDFQIPSILEAIGISYTGTDARGMLLSSDKVLTKQVLSGAGVRVPGFAKYPGFSESQLAALNPPFILKPLSGGGSEGITRRSFLTSRKQAKKRSAEFFEAWGSPVMCEEFICGREISVGVIGNGRPQVLPAGEWKFGSRDGPKFVTERVKWNKAYCKLWNITYKPAKLTSSEAQTVRESALSAYKATKLRDYAAIDMRLCADGALYVLDVNANPGLWPGSGRWSSIPFNQLIERLVRMAAVRRRRVRE